MDEQSKSAVISVILSLLLIGVISYAFVMIIYRWFFSRIVLQEFENGVVFKKGKYCKTLSSGRHHVRLNCHTVIVDLRQENFAIQQNVMTADNINLGLNMTMTIKVVNPYSAVISTQNYRQEAFDETRSQIKDFSRNYDIKFFLENTKEFESIILSKLTYLKEKIGIEVLKLEIIDIIIPSSIQEALASGLINKVKKEDESKKIGF